jgi:hypothetical protein
MQMLKIRVYIVERNISAPPPPHVRHTSFTTYAIMQPCFSVASIVTQEGDYDSGFQTVFRETQGLTQ